MVWLHHWTPTLLSFRVTRNPQMVFVPGHYARLGLESPGTDVVWRPYSMVSAADATELEFVSVLVPGGAFSAALARLKVGDPIRVERPVYGFLTIDQLAPGRDLWLIASGTGIGPFVSILHDPAVWRDYQRIFLAHSVRTGAELAYRDEIEALQADGLFDGANARLTYLPLVTREPGSPFASGRIPRLLRDGTLDARAGAPLEVATSRVMVCGNPALAAEMRALLNERGFKPSRRGMPGQMAFEKYW